MHDWTWLLYLAPFAICLWMVFSMSGMRRGRMMGRGGMPRRRKSDQEQPATSARQGGPREAGEDDVLPPAPSA